MNRHAAPLLATPRVFAAGYDPHMAESDCLQILLSHDRWATAQLLAVCSQMSADQFTRRFDIGPGSLHDTFTHIIGAMRTWTETLAEIELRPRLETDGQHRTPDQLLSLFEEAWQALTAEARRRPLSESVVRQLRNGPTIRITRAAALTHVATHGMHHRAQCLNMLRRIGVSPLPPNSVAEWTWLGETQDAT